MSHPPRTSIARAAVAVAMLAAAAGAQASQDLTLVIGTCPPGSAQALQTDLKLTNGAVRKAGRNPPSMYFCQVPIDDFAAVPSWNTLELQFVDGNTGQGGNVRAHLVRKSLKNGAATAVATVRSEPSDEVRTLAVPLPGRWDFASFGYFVIVELETPQAPVEAHAVRLSTR